MKLRTRITKLEKVAGVGQPLHLEDYLAALDALEAGAAEVRLGAAVITRADWLVGGAEGRQRGMARRREQTDSAELPSADEPWNRLLEGANKL